MMKVKLKNKIIDLEDFFKYIAGKLRKSVGLKCFYFLVPYGNNGDFVTSYSTRSTHPRLTKREVYILSEEVKKDIFYLRTIFQHGGFSRKVIQIKINWKFRLYGVSAIMPIHHDDKIICLILFTDKFVDDRINKNHYFIDMIQQEITHCLETILLYNQTLERIIKDYDL